MKDIAFIYRDPLFGIAVLIAIIAIVALADYSRNYYRSKKRLKSLKNLAKSYEYSELSEGVMEFLTLADNPVPTLMFLAQTYARSGDSEQAIKIYLSMLEKTPESKDKIPILEALGVVYFNVGFLQRAKNIFLEVLKSYAKNPTALSYLMRTYESMGEYKKALEVLDCLDELEFADSKTNQNNQNGEDININEYKNYLYLMMVINENFLSLEQKESEIVRISQEDASLKKIALSYFKIYKPSLFWQQISSLENIYNFMDLLWTFSKNEVLFEKIQNNQGILDIFRAKGYIDDGKECEIFELELLRSLRIGSHLRGNIDFEYRCHSCKSIFPFDSHRCPSCSELGIMDIVLKLRKLKGWDNQ